MTTGEFYVPVDGGEECGVQEVLADRLHVEIHQGRGQAGRPAHNTKHQCCESGIIYSGSGYYLSDLKYLKHVWKTKIL